jgi:hypothetical protein
MYGVASPTPGRVPRPASADVLVLSRSDNGDKSFPAPCGDVAARGEGRRGEGKFGLFPAWLGVFSFLVLGPCRTCPVVLKVLVVGILVRGRLILYEGPGEGRRGGGVEPSTTLWALLCNLAYLFCLA